MFLVNSKTVVAGLEGMVPITLPPWYWCKRAAVSASLVLVMYILGSSGDRGKIAVCGRCFGFAEEEEDKWSFGVESGASGRYASLDTVLKTEIEMVRDGWR